MASVLLRKAEGEVKHRGESPVKRAEIGVMKPGAKECLEPPETGGSKDRLSLRAFSESRVLHTLILNFWPLISIENKFLIF